MKFPPWVENPSFTTEQKASKRMMFLLRRAALNVCQKASIRALATETGIDRKTLYDCITFGKCSTYVADKVEALVGRAVIRREWLLDPMKIKQ